MNESKDRAALRALLAVEQDDQAKGSQDWNQRAWRAIDQSNDALAQPDPVPALVEALREMLAAEEMLGREESDRDPTAGEEAIFRSARAARAALKAATGE
jgi:hypothetical protein